MAFVYKLMIVGYKETGKTTLRYRLAHTKKTDRYHSTIGVDFNVIKTPLYSGRIDLKLQVFEIGGQDRFFNLIQRYTSLSTNAIALVFDLNDRTSFAKLTAYMDVIKNTYAEHNVHIPTIILVATNTSGIHPPGAIHAEEITAFCQLHHINQEKNYFQISIESGSVHETSFSSFENRVQELSEELVLRSFKGRLAKINYQGPINPEFFCPISNEIMEDPITTTDGQTFDRGSLVDYFSANGNPECLPCPLTRENIHKDVLKHKTSVFVKQTISAFITRIESHVPQEEKKPSEKAASHLIRSLSVDSFFESSSLKKSIITEESKMLESMQKMKK